MEFADAQLAADRPGHVRDVSLPRRQPHHPSPADWRDEVLYFLLPDRFSDGGEDARPLLDRRDLAAARPGLPGGEPWRWDRWAESGTARWQGGTLAGIRSKLGYLRGLGVTTLWIGPVFKQRGHLDTYHGYGVQDFLDVDPHFGSRRDLVELVADAHARGLRVILDVIFNHSGANWLYPPDAPGGPLTPHYRPDRYAFGAWRGPEGARAAGVEGAEA
ncbi:MAG TPA: alpha-amylase family glycosyl hydrolase, partial [Methylomirabilota bacterium]|nr:alpha-amylase family glycosyl hydrolase [Methylomirabilota bacterium]